MLGSVRLIGVLKLQFVTYQMQIQSRDMKLGKYPNSTGCEAQFGASIRPASLELWNTDTVTKSLIVTYITAKSYTLTTLSLAYCIYGTYRHAQKRINLL